MSFVTVNVIDVAVIIVVIVDQFVGMKHHVMTMRGWILILIFLKTTHQSSLGNESKNLFVEFGDG